MQNIYIIRSPPFFYKSVPYLGPQPRMPMAINEEETQAHATARHESTLQSEASASNEEGS